MIATITLTIDEDSVLDAKALRVHVRGERGEDVYQSQRFLLNSMRVNYHDGQVDYVTRECLDAMRGVVEKFAKVACWQYPITPSKTCVLCGGNGYVVTEHFRDGQGTFCDVTTTCKACNGSGGAKMEE